MKIQANEFAASGRNGSRTATVDDASGSADRRPGAGPQEPGGRERRQRARADHQRNVQYVIGMFGRVVARAVRLLVLRLEVVDALDLAVEVPVARNDRTYGIRIENTSSLPSGVPIVKIENEAGCSVSHSASAAAIFIGWTLGHDLALEVAGDAATSEAGDEQHHRARPAGGPERGVVRVRPPGEPPQRDRRR